LIKLLELDKTGQGNPGVITAEHEPVAPSVILQNCPLTQSLSVVQT